MEVLGRDIAQGAYRVRLVDGGRVIDGLVPEALIAGELAAGGPRHQGAYEWLARNHRPIARALTDLSRGRVPRAPFHAIALAQDS